MKREILPVEVTFCYCETHDKNLPTLKNPMMTRTNTIKGLVNDFFQLFSFFNEHSKWSKHVADTDSAETFPLRSQGMHV